MQGSTTPQLLQKSALIVGDLTDTNGERGIIGSVWIELIFAETEN